MYLLFDIGGTNVRMAVSDGKKLGVAVTFKTPARFRDGAALLSAEAKKLLQGARPAAVSGGIAGVVDPKFGIQGYSPNLKGWIGKPLVSELKKIFKCPVLLENDAALAGLGEARHGAGRGGRIVAYFTFSTGVGGARIVNGRIDARTYGFEPGATVLCAEVLPRPSAGQDDQRSGFVTLEDAVGGANVARHLVAHPEKERDPKFWDGVARQMAYGLHNAIMFWSPDTIVLGGGMILKEPCVSIARIGFHLRRISRVFPKLPEIKRAALGDENGLYGALCAADLRASNADSR